MDSSFCVAKRWIGATLRKDHGSIKTNNPSPSELSCAYAPAGCYFVIGSIPRAHSSVLEGSRALCVLTQPCMVLNCVKSMSNLRSSLLARDPLPGDGVDVHASVVSLLLRLSNFYQILYFILND